jgi:hypothetical protein
MRTTLDIDEDLLRQAQELSGIRGKTAVIEEGLRTVADGTLDLHDPARRRYVRPVRWIGRDGGRRGRRRRRGSRTGAGAQAGAVRAA